jgi:hypothetical protein
VQDAHSQVAGVCSRRRGTHRGWLTLMAGTGQALVVFLGIAVAAFSLVRASATMPIVVNRPCLRALSGRVNVARHVMPRSRAGS